MSGAAEVDKVNLLGICEGGVFTLAYAALEPDRVQNLVLTITPLDFHADEDDSKPGSGFINVWARSLTGEDVDRMIDVWGVLPGEFMSAVFNMLTPVRSMTKYNLDMLDVVDNEAKLLNFLRMEKWLADRPHHAGEAAKQWLKDLYQENQAHQQRMGTGRPESRPQPGHHAGAQHLRQADHIIPPATVARIGPASSEPMTTPRWVCRGGHIGMFVSSKSQGIVGKGIVDWLAERDN